MCLCSLFRPEARHKPPRKVNVSMSHKQTSMGGNLVSYFPFYSFCKQENLINYTMLLIRFYSSKNVVLQLMQIVEWTAFLSWKLLTQVCVGVCMRVFTASGKWEGVFGKRSGFQSGPGSAVWIPHRERQREQQQAAGTVCHSGDLTIIISSYDVWI